MRILLVHPPSKEMFRGYLPLGLAYIAGYLLRHGHEVTVWDVGGERWSKPEVLERIEVQGGSHHLIGISGLAGDYPYVKWITKAFRRQHPGAKIVLGGYLASALPRFLMEDLPLDFVAVGEGEETMVELAKALADGSDAGQVRGIYFRDGSGEIAAAPPRERLGSLDQLPFPPWEYFPMDGYLQGGDSDDSETSGNNGPGLISIMASRGCPFDCSYCDHTIKGYKLRYRPVESVIHEIKKLLAGYGDKIREFYFWDDILIWDRDWIQEFCETLLREDLGIKWTCNCHVSKVEPRLMSRMKEAGCVNVRFGIESGSQRILDSLNKNVRVEDARKSLQICLDAGLGLTIYTMVGMTGEDRETINATVEFFRALADPLYARQIRSVNFFMLTPFPGTRLFEEAKRNGILGDTGEFLERGCDAYDDIPLNISGQTDRSLFALKKDFEHRVSQVLRDARDRFNKLLTDMARELRA